MRKRKESNEPARRAGFVEEAVKPWGAPPVAVVDRPPGASVRPPLKVSAPFPRVRTKVGPGGRLVLPAAFRAAAGMDEGAEVMISLHDEEVRIITPQAGLRRAQKMLRARLPTGRNLVDELIAERREEARREEEDGH